MWAFRRVADIMQTSDDEMVVSPDLSLPCRRWNGCWRLAPNVSWWCMMAIAGVGDSRVNRAPSLNNAILPDCLLLRDRSCVRPSSLTRCATLGSHLAVVGYCRLTVDARGYGKRRRSGFGRLGLARKYGGIIQRDGAAALALMGDHRSGEAERVPKNNRPTATAIRLRAVIHTSVYTRRHLPDR